MSARRFVVFDGPRAVAAPGFFSADVPDDGAVFAVADLLASAEFDAVPVALRCLTAEFDVPAFEFDRVAFDSDELDRADPLLEFDTLPHELPPEP